MYFSFLFAVKMMALIKVRVSKEFTAAAKESSNLFLQIYPLLLQSPTVKINSLNS